MIKSQSVNQLNGRMETHWTLVDWYLYWYRNKFSKKCDEYVFVTDL